MHQGGSVILCFPDFHGLVANNLRVGVGGVDIELDGVLIHVAIVDAVDTTFLPVGVHPVEQKVDGVEMLEGMQDVIPTKGEEAAVGFLVGLCEVGDAEAETYEIVVLVDDELDEVEVDKGEIFLYVYAYLLFGHGDEVIEILEAVVEGVEELPGIGHDVLAAFHLDEAQVVLLHDEGVEACHLIGNGLVGRHDILLPFAFDFVSSAFDEFDVVFGVVQGGDVLACVEVVYSPALLVHIGEAEGAFYLCHTILPAIFHHFVEQSLENLVVLDEVEPSEADGLLLPVLVDAAVDDGGHTSYHFAVTYGEVEFARTMLQRGVLVGEELALVAVQSRDISGNTLEEFVGEGDKFFKVGATFNGMDSNHGLL